MERWKETFNEQFSNLKFKLRKVQPVEFIIAFVIFVVGIILSFREFQDNRNELYLLWLLILVGIIIGSYIWIKAVNRYFGRFSYYLVEHKFTRKIISGGSFSYFEYEDPETKKKSTLILDPLSQIFTLLLAFVGISVFFMGFLGPERAENPLIWGVLAFLVPIIATPLVPVLWGLQATKVKAFASGNNTTWMVGKKYKTKFNSIITIAAVYSNLREANAGDIVDQLKIFFEVVKVGTLILLIPTSVFIIIYYGWFKEELSGKLRESLSLKTYKIVLEEHETPKVDDIDGDAEPAKEMVKDSEREAETVEELEIPEAPEEIEEEPETEEPPTDDLLEKEGEEVGDEKSEAENNDEEMEDDDVSSQVKKGVEEEDTDDRSY